MESEKFICATITLHGDQALAPNIDEILLDNARQEFENKCHNGMLIRHIGSVTQRGMVYQSRDSLDGSSICDVEFKATGIIVEKDMPIFKAKIINIDDMKIIICETEFCQIYMKFIPALQTLKKDQEIVVIAKMSRYIIGRNMISVNAIPFMPLPEQTIIFHCDKLLHALDSPDIMNAIKKIIDLENQLLLHDKKTLGYFTKLIYPFKEIYKDPVNMINIKDLVKIKGSGKIILCHSNKYSPSKCILFKDIKEVSKVFEDVSVKEFGDSQIVKNKDSLIVKENFLSVILLFLSKYTKYLNTLNGLCKHYPSNNDIEKNKNLWDIYTKFKL